MDASRASPGTGALRERERLPVSSRTVPAGDVAQPQLDAGEILEDRRRRDPPAARSPGSARMLRRVLLVGAVRKVEAGDVHSARTSASRISGDSEAGPMVQTILARGIRILPNSVRSPRGENSGLGSGHGRREARRGPPRRQAPPVREAQRLGVRRAKERHRHRDPRGDHRGGRACSSSSSAGSPSGATSSSFRRGSRETRVRGRPDRRRQSRARGGDRIPRRRRSRVLTEGPPSPGLSDEIVTFYLARRLTRVGKGGGVGEENIRVHEVPSMAPSGGSRSAGPRAGSSIRRSSARSRSRRE